MSETNTLALATTITITILQDQDVRECHASSSDHHPGEENRKDECYCYGVDRPY